MLLSVRARGRLATRLFVVSAVAAALVLAACSSSDETPTTQPAPSVGATAASTSAPTAAPTPAGGGATRDAVIASFALPTLTIPAGTTVSWTNQDDLPHTATADDGSWDSGTLTAGVFTHTFVTPGTFAYHCDIHPTMTGTIVVE